MTKPKPKWLITVASWEDRFCLGTERLLDEHSFTNAILFFYSESEDWTERNRKAVKEMFDRKGVAFHERRISFKAPVSTWHALQEEVAAVDDKASDPLVDFTTMPRDTLWSLLSLLGQRGFNVSYAYHRPEDYAAWLSRDPGRPRLVYRLSGLATLGRPTCLIIATGFDPERTRQLMWHYEPRQVLLVFQSGVQYDNTLKNIEKHQTSLKEEYNEFDVEEFQLDAYSEDRGRAILLELAKQRVEECNVVMTSLGPKIGAIAMYEVHQAIPETALVYTPSGEFNPDYSNGISQTYEGIVSR